MLFKCSKHFSSLAGWRCSSCGATLCADCTGIKKSGESLLEICSKCGGFATAIKVSRSELSPFSAAQLVQTLRWPFSKAGILSVFATAVVVTGLGFFGPKPAAIAIGVTIAYLFQIVRHTAHGKDDVPGPEDFQGYAEDVIGPSWRVTVALAWIWVPALVWWFTHRTPEPDMFEAQQAQVSAALAPGGRGLSVHGMRARSSPTGLEVVPADAPPQEITPEQRAMGAVAEPEEKADDDPTPEAGREAAAPEAAPEPPPPPPPSRSPLIPILLVLAGALIVPMSLIASALKTPLMVAANPIVLAGYAWKLGRDYLLLVGFCLLALVAAYALRAAEMLAVGNGFLARLPLNLVTITVAFIAFRAIGLLVRARGSDLGYGAEDFYLVPVLGEAKPNWVAAPAAPAEAEPPLPQPVAMEISPADSFAALFAQNDADGMLALLETSGKEIAFAVLPAKAWMDLAGQAWQRKKGKPAAVCLKRCIDAEPIGPLAPKAWLLAARVYAELMNDKATSDKLLAELVKRFPGTEPARVAAQRLGG